MLYEKIKRYFTKINLDTLDNSYEKHNKKRLSP